MSGIDKSTRRAIVVIVLVMLVAAALRGYVPGAERPAARGRPGADPAALYVVVVLLALSVLILVMAIVTRLRDRRTRPAAAAWTARDSVAGGRPPWRVALIALTVLIAWLATVALLARITGHDAADRPDSNDTATAEPASSSTATDGKAPPPDPPVPPRDEGSDVFDRLAIPMVVLMVVAVAGVVVTTRRKRPDVEAPEVAAPTPVPPVSRAAESLARAAELGLAEIADHSREPRQAIIACYAAMERELMRVPGAAPQDFDTPREVLARAVDRNALRADSATRLVELFEEARFSPHVMDEGHRDDAVDVLHRVLAELPAPAPAGAT